MQLKCITLGSSIALEGLCYSKLSHVRRFSSFCNRSCKILNSIHTIARRRCILSDWVSVSCQILSFVDPVGPSNFFGPSENNKLGEFPISQFWVGVPHYQSPLSFLPIFLFYFFVSNFPILGWGSTPSASSLFLSSNFSQFYFLFQFLSFIFFFQFFLLFFVSNFPIFGFRSTPSVFSSLLFHQRQCQDTPSSETFPTNISDIRLEKSNGACFVLKLRPLFCFAQNFLLCSHNSSIRLGWVYLWLLKTLQPSIICMLCSDDLESLYKCFRY